MLRLSARATILGSILIPINCYWLIISRQPYQYQPIPTIISPFFNVIFILLLLVIFNQVLARFLPRSVLNREELIIIYVMLSVASAIQSFQMMQTLTTMMEVPFRRATVENDWKNLFGKYIPNWLSVSNKKSVMAYYQGDSTFYHWPHIVSWFMPALWWSGFIIVLVFVMHCITLYVRVNWVEHERLSYPIIQLPLAMSHQTRLGIRSNHKSIFSQNALWFGVAISGGIALINGLADLFPTIPPIKIHPRNHNLSQYITAQPWRSMGAFRVGVVAPVIGLAFFMPLDMSISCVFFFFLSKVQRIVAVSLGAQQVAYSGYLVYLNQQSFGALAGITVIALWSGHKLISGTSVMRNNRQAQLYPLDRETKKDFITLKWPLLGIALGIIILSIFMWKAGLSIWLALSFFILYYFISLGVARFRAEMGVPLHDFHFTGPDQMLPSIFSPRRLGYKNISIMSMLGFFNFTYRAHPQPHQIEGYALLNRAKAHYGLLFPSVMIALVVGVVSFFWIYLHTAYQHGGSSLERFAHVVYTRLANWLTGPSDGIDYGGLLAIGTGFGAVIWFNFMRQYFLWWKLHPAGYAISNSLDINHFWFSILVGSFLKHLLIRYGGIKKYQQAQPFFLGLILGEYTIGSIWTIVGNIIHQQIFFGGSF